MQEVGKDMKKADFIWMDGAMLPWEQAQVHVLTHALHYATAVFEGIRFYNTHRGRAILCLDDHIARLYYSFSAFSDEVPFSKKEIKQAIEDLIKVNKLQYGYVRPLIYFGEGPMGMGIDEGPVHVAISAWEWEKQLGESAINVLISDIIRLHPQSTHIDKKISGHYVNSILANRQAKKLGYDAALLFDYRENIAEGAAQNFFIVQNGVVKTPPLGSILPGITRNIILQLARDQQIPVEETTLVWDDIVKADEAFFCGTATEITPIKSITHAKRETKKFIYDNFVGPITITIIDSFKKVIDAKNEKYNTWLTFID